MLVLVIVSGWLDGRLNWNQAGNNKQEGKSL
jgi:hypothetical protein